MRIIHNRHFWSILVLFAFCIVLHYAELIGIVGTTEPSLHFGLTRHALDRILFLIPIIYSAYVFGLTGGLGISFAALLVMLPRATLLSPAPADAVLETVGVILVGTLASLWSWTLAKAKGKTEAALAQLKSAHEVLQRYVQSARRDEKRRTILSTISALLGESLQLEKTLQRAIHMISELMEVEITLIFSLDEENNKLKLVAYEGVSDEFARAVDGQEIGSGYYGEVAKICQPVVLDSTSNDPRLTTPEVSKMQIQTQLIVPMIIRDQISGVLCVAMRRPRQFAIEDIELLTGVGTQIAIAIENAHLYEKEHLTAQRLAVSERNYRQLFENANDAIWVHDLEGNIIAANEAAGKLVGYSVKELTKMNVKNFLSDENVNLAGEVRRKLLEREPVEQPYEQSLIRKDGTKAILRLATSLVTEDGKSIGFQHMARDITEQKRAEEMLTKIIDGSPVPTFAINKQHKVTHWNTAIESLSGVKKEEVVNTDQQWMIFYSEKRPVMADLIVDGASLDEIEVYYRDTSKKSQLIDGAYEAEDFFPALGEDGKWLYFTASPIKDDTGEIIGAIETLRDVTDGKRMQDNLRYYLREITRAQEEERKRIARELHDVTAQALYALNRQVDNFARGNTNLLTDNAAFLESLGKQIKEVLQDVRRFGQDLRPPMLDDLGLLAALRWLVSELKEQHGIEADLRVLGTERRFTPETELVLFRIAQEAMRNVGRHSQASKAEATIEFGDDRIRVSIKDNGVGFHLPENLEDLSRTGKLGLIGMQERMRLLDGSIKIESEPGKGTTVMVEIPI